MPSHRRVLPFGLVLVGAAISVILIAGADRDRFGAIGGRPNETLRKLTADNTDPYVFKEDRDSAKAPPAPPRKDESGKPVKPKPVLPETYSRQCWAAPLDLSGIPWHYRISGVAISRRHIVTAAHWSELPPRMAFQSRNGKKVVVGLLPADPADHPGFEHAGTRKPEVPACWINLGHDVAIATTAKPLPESIAVYPLPAPCRPEQRVELIGRSVVSTAWSDDNHQPEPKGLRLAGVRRVKSFMGESVVFEKEPELPGALYFNAVVGDSGNPLFFLKLKSRKLVLASTYTGGGGGSGPYYGSSVIQDNIRSYIAASPAPGEMFTSSDLGAEE